MVNTKVTLTYDKNLDHEKIVNYSKPKYKIIAVWILQQKLLTFNINENIKFLYYIYIYIYIDR